MSVLEQLAGGSGDDGDDYADTERPSFSCRNVRHEAELAICRSTRLARLDRKMAALYGEVRDETTGWRARRRLAKSQRRWLGSRNECGDERRCIRKAYESRLDVLADYKRDLKPGYQRTARWRSVCRNLSKKALRATCTDENLWELNLSWYAAFDRAKDRIGRNSPSLDRYFERFQDKWEACGSSNRCQRRAYRKSISELQDRKFLRQLRRKDRVVPDWQTSDIWQETCRDDDAATQFTCKSEELWRLYLQVVQAFRRANEDTRAERRRKRLREDHEYWSGHWRACRGDEFCQRRRFSERIERLRRGYNRDDDLDRLASRMSRVYYRELADIRNQRVREAFNARHLRWNSQFKACANNSRCKKQWYREYTALLQDPRERRRLRDGARGGYGDGGSLAALASRMSAVYQDELSRIRRPEVREAFNARHLQWNAQFKACGNNSRCKKQWYREYTALLQDPRERRRLRDGARGGYGDGGSLAALASRMSAVYQDELNRIRRPAVREAFNARHLQWNAQFKACGNNTRCKKQWYREYTALLQDPRERRRLRDGARDGYSDDGNLSALASRMSAVYQDELSRIRRPEVRAAFNARHLQWNSQFKACGNNSRCKKQWYRDYTALLRDPAARQELLNRAAPPTTAKRKRDPYGANSNTR